MITVGEIRDMLDGYTFRSNTETELHDGVCDVLDAHGITYRREHRLSAADRVDVLVDGGIAVEVKAGRTSTRTDVAAQLQRYAGHDDVAALLLVTTRPSHTILPLRLGGKPLQFVLVGGGR